MTKGIHKRDLPSSTGSIHKAKALPDDLLRFSFRHFQTTAKFDLPEQHTKPEYLDRLLYRLKDVSDYTVKKFRTEKNQSLRAHRLDWNDTTQPDGFAHLSEQLQQCEAWQFCLSANEHGRVHGILIDEVFYVVWLDHGHALYS